MKSLLLYLSFSWNASCCIKSTPISRIRFSFWVPTLSFHFPLMNITVLILLVITASLSLFCVNYENQELWDFITPNIVSSSTSQMPPLSPPDGRNNHICTYLSENLTNSTVFCWSVVLICTCLRELNTEPVSYHTPIAESSSLYHVNAE